MTAVRRALTDPRTRFVLWAVVGAGGCLALLSILSIGLFIAPVVALLAVVLLLTTPADRSVLGAVSGVSLPLFLVAWLNRDGPGTVCQAIANGESCSEQWNPWPWLLAGLALAAIGVAAFQRWGRARVPV